MTSKWPDGKTVSRQRVLDWICMVFLSVFGLASVWFGQGLASEPKSDPSQGTQLTHPPAGAEAEPAETSSSTGATLIRRRDWESRLHSTTRLSSSGAQTLRHDIAVAVGPVFGSGFYPSGWPYGPPVAPAWSYPGLAVGPYVGYPWGFPGYSARAGSFWSNGLSLYGPPVPVYGPIPGVLGNDDLVRQWRAVPNPGFPFGWVGIFAASPRPRSRSVQVWPTLEPIGDVAPSSPSRDSSAPSPSPQSPLDQTLPIPRQLSPSARLTLSIRVPQPMAEVWINGQLTRQVGLERLYESPPLLEQRSYEYEVLVRWLHNGLWQVERRQVRGRPGEVLRLDFSR